MGSYSHTLARTHAHTASDIHGLAFTQNHTHITDPCGTAVHSHGWPPIIHLYYNITHVERTHTRTHILYTHGKAISCSELQTLQSTTGAFVEDNKNFFSNEMY